MTTETLEKILTILREAIKNWTPPAVGQIADEPGDRAFRVLISTVLSLRTKDTVTIEASRRLLRTACTPEGILKIPIETVKKLIYPVGFYHTKAKHLLEICKILIEKYNSEVPRDIDKLLELPGVGRKTANLVMTLGFDEYGICVDTHVHRISNVWGYVKTKTPDDTEQALRKKLPMEHWKTYNDILVTFGQNLCVPISPWCSKCPVKKYCPRIGVKRSR